MTTPREAEYRARACLGRVSCALSLLAVWERPWSPTAKRFAFHALTLAYAKGLVILD